MPFMSPRACLTAWPSAIPTSSVVWCWSICKSPLALTVRSMRECRARRSSIWSRNRIPVPIEDGQVSIGQTIIKANAKKVRRLGKGDVIGGFAGATADAFTLFERLESKLEQYPGQLTRAAVELAKDWRTDRYLRRLEAMMIVADKE